MEKSLLLKNRFSRRKRFLWGGFIISAALLILSGAICVPFIFESQTLRYQFGVSRKLLLAAHFMGTAATVILFSQILLISRIRIFDRIFSINRLLLQHRINAVILLFLVISHLVLILSSLGWEVLARDARQWPEFTGLLLLFMLTGMALSGIFREYIGVSFRIWLFFHRISVPSVFLLLFIHVYFVSETFHQGSAEILMLSFILICFLFYSLNRVKRLSALRCAYRVDKVYEAGSDIHAVELISEKERRVINLPGQFAFLKISSGNITGEEHPFTISSTPTRPPVLQFTIRSSGDWTKNIRHLKRGDRAFVSGPFGIFGHIDPESSREIIMIAGGIGITPMLSMLRYLSDVKSSRRITLVWTLRTRKEVVYPEEFRFLEENLSGLTISYFFTRGESGRENSVRLTGEDLEKLISSCSRESVILLCGPPGMMTQVKKSLILLDFPGKSIITERFVL